ncbi:class I SAM-dependent methyltransferase [Tenacibaculum agarivorans]|uniref:class I SAM-dependent methyltransferase n=1 Tax=Tenacibaculum agarivorans TaxID=1908389 RepID=UPI00094B80AD|nr:class I SAM-dependent methyltransferase [Tenacibaculum agarivorans]
MKKIVIKRFLAKLNLLPLIEQLNFYRLKFKNRHINNQFVRENPNIKLPPDFYIYETFQLNYKKYYTNGLPTAMWLIELVSEFKLLENSAILDWGCGTGRILRHLPKIAGNTNYYFGCDYNPKYVKWCQENLKNIDFQLNQVTPPLPYEDQKFDFVYGISIFTHLSLEQHQKWFEELYRILKPNGILFLTTHGDAHKFKLTEKEQLAYTSGDLIIHDFKKEGNRLFAAYQPPSFMHQIASKNKLKILKHIPGEIKNDTPQQDVWIFMK